MIIHKHLDDNFEYDGSQINPNWGFKRFKIKGSSIITWIGSMNIKNENLKDYEDVGLDIKSNEIINCVVEHFDIQPGNLRTAYIRQRLLVMILSEELTKQGVKTLREGDDIYIHTSKKSKLTVSIATASLNSIKIHLGINLTDDGSPDDVDVVGLYQLKDKEGNSYFNQGNVVEFIDKFVNHYINELQDIELDVSKTSVF
ncbi:MAG: DUF366 family protein [Methanobrevibacter sp.]|jgi:hypothetical protein|nr:DUF366 family protein [Candidatus Methanovirga aequatorialis]